MNTIACKGLDGSNPLHFLAALGLLRLADRITSGASMAWTQDSGVWHPVLETPTSREILFCAAAELLRTLGKTQSADFQKNRRVRELAARIKKESVSIKEAKVKARQEAKGQGMKGKAAGLHVAQKTSLAEASLGALETELVRAREELAMSMGAGIAHFGDVIAVSPGIVRRAGADAVESYLGQGKGLRGDAEASRFLADHLAALACDQVVRGGRVLPTRYSFGNGAGGQCLLKDFRNIAVAVTEDCFKATIDGDETGRYAVGMTNLNWDPGANRSYALLWDNPEKTAKRTDIAANALAYVGLGLLTAVPSRSRLVAIGWGPEDEWTWPLWMPRIGLDSVRALLASKELMREKPDMRALQAYGVVQLLRSKRIDPTGQGRPYFAPAQHL